MLGPKFGYYPIVKSEKSLGW